MSADGNYESGTGRADGSITQLLKHLVQQVSALFRQEISLARAEVGEAVGHIGSAAVMLVLGAILGMAALIILLFAAVYGLADVMPMWAAALAVGAVVAVIALFLVLRGKNNLAARNLMPRRTARTLRDDAQLAKDIL